MQELTRQFAEHDNNLTVDYYKDRHKTMTKSQESISVSQKSTSCLQPMVARLCLCATMKYIWIQEWGYNKIGRKLLLGKIHS